MDVICVSRHYDLANVGTHHANTAANRFVSGLLAIAIKPT